MLARMASRNMITSRQMDPDLSSKLDLYLRELKDKAPQMFELFEAIAKLDESKMSVGQWCQDFQRFRVYEQLGYDSLGAFLRAMLGIDKEDPQYIKARNSWMNIIRAYQRGKKGVRVRIAS